MEVIKNYIVEIIDISRYFSLPDYLVLVCIMLIILLFFLMSVAMRFYALLATMFFAISNILLFASPFIYQAIMELYIKKAELTLKHNESLRYDDSYYVEGTLKNVGLLDFKGCSVRVNFIPKNLKKIDTIKYKIKPKFQIIKDYKTPLSKQDSMDFKIIIPSPNPNLRYNLQTQGTCF